MLERRLAPGLGTGIENPRGSRELGVGESSCSGVSEEDGLTDEA